ncbi:Photosystem I chlorophyll a apoprotein A2 [Capsicum baccatum]|uniref:Photosystem I chlorophyll a apoprotein A2 n=1 Tax=Capsicum baccatum TaxID=33114 RepID=A0A2G2VNH3_CAPBA|nr:Photosystem I chlorophyll a apoprotein A2 [Capsicum baccatum]
MIIRSPETEVKILVDRDPVKTFFEEWARPGHFSRTIAKEPDTTTWIWNLHADAHDFDSHTSDLEEISQKDPVHVRLIAHAIWDLHFGQPAVEAFTRGDALGPVNIAYSGVYQWWYTIDIRTNQDLYTGALFLLFLSAISLIAGHLVHAAIHASRGEYVWWNNFLDILPHPQGLGPLLTGLALASLGVITSLVAQLMYSLPTYAFIAQDLTTQAALYTHLQYIAGFIMTGAFAHVDIFIIRYYNPEQNEDNVLARMLDHKEAIISHLSWDNLFLGFHNLGLYVHNNVMLAFGTP